MDSTKQYHIDELQGLYLNLAVSKVVGISACIFEVNNGVASFNRCCVLDNSGRLHHQYEPSSNWIYGGPLIDEHKIPVYRSLGDKWVAFKDCYSASGETMLIAAMRCMVKFKLQYNIIEM